MRIQKSSGAKAPVVGILVMLVAGGCQLIGGFDDFQPASGTGGQGGTATDRGGAGGAGGGAGGQSSGGSPAGGTPGTGGAAGPTCPRDAGVPGNMVSLHKPNGDCYFIDRNEVTNADYAAFLGAHPDPTLQTSVCKWNHEFDSACQTDGGHVTSTAPSQPRVCVDWCDAAAFCTAAGKELCPGEYGSGSFDDARKSTWYAACSDNGANDYAYGDAHDPTLCNESGRASTGCGKGSCTTTDVGSLTGCHTPAGVNDLTGNVAEWVAECDAVSGETDSCYVRGGSVAEASSAVTCASAAARTRPSLDEFTGFRCCLIR